VLSSDPSVRASRLVDATEAWLEAGEVERARPCAEALLDLVQAVPEGVAAISTAALAIRWQDGPRRAATRLLNLRDDTEPGRGRDVLGAIAADELRVAGELMAASRLEPAADWLASDERFRQRRALREASDAMAGGDLSAVRCVLDGTFPLDPGRSGPLEAEARAMRAACRLRSGDLLGGYAAAEETVRLSVGGPQSVAADLVAARCEAIFGGGDSCRIRLARIIDQASRLDLGLALIDAHEVKGLLGIVEGKVDDAVDVLRAATQAMAAWGWPKDRGDAWAELVEALVAAGRSPEAKALATALEAGPGPWSQGRTARAVGVAFHDAVELDRAVGLLAPFPFERARALLALGELTRAETCLEEAERLFSVMGALPWAERASTAGQRSAGPFAALTAAEVRVALEVGQGRSNKEAAEALFLSVKTVDFHLQSIYRKLEIRSRGELAGIVGRAALVGAP
jgi:DNA-binding CsgD family transcriptional regulator